MIYIYILYIYTCIDIVVTNPLTAPYLVVKYRCKGEEEEQEQRRESLNRYFMIHVTVGKNHKRARLVSQVYKPRTKKKKNNDSNFVNR